MILKSVTITDFRSINGHVEINLDAPVVLIHGSNGAGKTSIMSAIEFALTGEVQGLAKIDKKYLQHLTHVDRPSAEVALTGELHGRVMEAALSIKDGRVFGQPALPKDLRRFFSERCYLGQSTLSRLFEYYEQPADTRKESPLTLFVKDILGVDRLDDLIEGLRISGDKRRVRAEVPEYAHAESEQAVLFERSVAQKERVAELSLLEQERIVRIAEILEQLHGAPVSADVSDAAVSQSEAEDDDDANALGSLTTLRIQLQSMAREWADMSSTANSKSAAEAEERARLAQRELAAWRSSGGERLASVIESINDVLTNVPHPDVVDPLYAHSAALEVVEREIVRCDTLLRRQTAGLEKIASAGRSISEAEERRNAIVGQIAANDLEVDDFAQALNAIIPHIHSNVCPVCERDYSEISPASLSDEVAARVAALTERAARLRSLSNELRATEKRLATLQQDRDMASAQMISESEAERLVGRRDQMVNFNERLRTLHAAAQEGAALRAASADAERALALTRKRNRRGTALREALSELSQRIGQPSLTRNETLDAAIERLEGHLSATLRDLAARVDARKLLANEWRRLRDIRQELQAQRRALAETETVLASLGQAFHRVERVRSVARSITSAAMEERNKIVKRVFTRSLNRVWHDVFIRLAPDETFVPQFTIPKTATTALKVELETLHRVGVVGGPPAAMLSAGNLNTAALSLFLALHMSVEQKLPLLMLDDPVQSMDEVHVVQLAALLRVVSKTHRNLQIIVAIHERPLFEYLAFELAPSSPEDRLITVDIDRTTEGTTYAAALPHGFVRAGSLA